VSKTTTKKPKTKSSCINLTKKVKDLYNENYKALKKEIVEDMRKKLHKTPPIFMD
jgi:hypothetical protein